MILSLSVYWKQTVSAVCFFYSGKETVYMAKRNPDIKVKEFFDNPCHFAAIVNGTLLRKNPVKPSDIVELDKEFNRRMVWRGLRQRYRRRTGDIAKGVFINGVKAIVILEHQSRIQTIMSLRAADVLIQALSKEVSRIEIANEANPDIGRSTYFENGFSWFGSSDEISPAAVIVLYFGKDPWDRRLTVKSLIKEHPLKESVPELPMKLIDVRRMTPKELNAFRSDEDVFQLFSFIRYEGTDQFQQYYEENKTYLEKMPLAVYNVIYSLVGSKELRKIRFIETEPGKEAVNVCYGIQCMIENANKAVLKAQEAKFKAERKAEQRKFEKAERLAFVKGLLMVKTPIKEITALYAQNYHYSPSTSRKHVGEIIRSLGIS